ncbi:hypothetical protein Bpfe_012701, partial [Biomphalaria pfeifferi]
MDIYKCMYEIITSSTAVMSPEAYPSYNVTSFRNQGSRLESVSYGNRMGLSVN